MTFQFLNPIKFIHPKQIPIFRRDYIRGYTCVQQNYRFTSKRLNAEYIIIKSLGFHFVTHESFQTGKGGKMLDEHSIKITSCCECSP